MCLCRGRDRCSDSDDDGDAMALNPVEHEIAHPGQQKVSKSAENAPALDQQVILCYMLRPPC